MTKECEGSFEELARWKDFMAWLQLLMAMLPLP